jgi:ubiquitin carboxyl-terminal hydrolase 4/11/15
MNSGLQCISNTWELIKFFLHDNYKKQINMNNPLGTKGKLVTAFAEVMQSLWIDSMKSIAPFDLKKAISEVSTQVNNLKIDIEISSRVIISMTHKNF